MRSEPDLSVHRIMDENKGLGVQLKEGDKSFFQPSELVLVERYKSAESAPVLEAAKTTPPAIAEILKARRANPQLVAHHTPLEERLLQERQKLEDTQLSR